MRFFLNKMVSLCDTHWANNNKFAKFVKMAGFKGLTIKVLSRKITIWALKSRVKSTCLLCYVSFLLVNSLYWTAVNEAIPYLRCQNCWIPGHPLVRLPRCCIVFSSKRMGSWRLYTFPLDLAWGMWILWPQTVHLSKTFNPLGLQIRKKKYWFWPWNYGKWKKVVILTMK
jgi:hypothetical protein